MLSRMSILRRCLFLWAYLMQKAVQTLSTWCSQNLSLSHATRENHLDWGNSLLISVLVTCHKWSVTSQEMSVCGELHTCWMMRRDADLALYRICRLIGTQWLFYLIRHMWYRSADPSCCPGHPWVKAQTAPEPQPLVNICYAFNVFSYVWVTYSGPDVTVGCQKTHCIS